MRPRSRLRFSIGQWTALVAALGFLLSLPSQKSTADVQLLGSVVAFLILLLLVSVLIDALVGIPCPGCAHWTLRRLARASSYYCCSQCGGRYKRSPFSLGPWRDASGPEDAAIFRGKTRARSWLSFAIPEDDGNSTTGRLLRNLRRRLRATEAASARLEPLPLGAPMPGLPAQGNPSRDPVPPYESTGRLLRNRRKRSQAGKESGAAPGPLPQDVIDTTNGNDHLT